MVPSGYRRSVSTSLDEFFRDAPRARAVFDAVEQVVHSLGDVEVRVTKSQASFRARKGFAHVWVPGRYVRSDVAAVLSIALPGHVDSPRWKEVAYPTPTVWMHHLEVDEPGQIDDEVTSWLSAAYRNAVGGLEVL